MNKRATFVVALVLWFVVLESFRAGPVAAQTYPAKPTRYVVPYAAGGGTDILARLIADKLSSTWGVPVIVENRPGAAGRIGTEVVARATPDGYTMLLAINSHAINTSLYGKLPYDPIADFAPVILVATAPQVVTVHASLPARSIKELIALARSRRGELTYASGGPGSASHLGAELFNTMAKVKFIEVPYKSGTAAMTDLLGGHILMSLVTFPVVHPYVNSGRLRALAVTSKGRSTLAPELPTVAESGLPGYDVFSWFGTFAPAGTPPAIIERWNSEITKILAMRDIQEKVSAIGYELKGGTPEQFAQFVRSDWMFWDKVIKGLKIKLD